MNHIPVGAILLLLIVDLLVVVTLSLSSALMVARGADAPVWKGFVIGLLLPILGPFVWGSIVLTRDRGRAGIRKVQERSPALYAVAAGLLLAALAFLVGMVVPWGHVAGGYERYALAADPSAVDTGLGIAASVLTAIVLVASVVIVLVWTPWRRTALLLTAVGLVWFLIAIDALIVFSMIDGISETADGVSGGRATAEASPELGLWLALLGSVAVLGAALVLGFLPRDLPASAVPALASVTTPSSDWGSNDAWGSPPRPSTPASPNPGADYGDGY